MAESASPEQDGTRVVAPADIGTAFDLGWTMACLHVRGRPAASAPDVWRNGLRLPGLRGLTKSERTAIDLERAAAGATRLNETLRAFRVAPLVVTRLVDAYAKAKDPEEFRSAVYRQHREVLRRLHAASQRLGVAYTIGSTLEAVRRVEGAEPTREALARQKVRQLQCDLGDLEPWFPPHAAAAVSASLERWYDITGPESLWSAADGERPQYIRETLGHQADRWRDLLAGDTRAESLLRDEDYVAAAIGMAARAQHVATRTLRPFAPTLVALAFLIAGAVAAGMLLPAAGKIVAVTAALTAALGITWRGIGSALSMLARTLRAPLWQRELDRAVTRRIDLTRTLRGVPNKEQITAWREAPRQPRGTTDESAPRRHLPHARRHNPRAVSPG